MTRQMSWVLCAAVAVMISACGGSGTHEPAPAATSAPAQKVGDGPFKPPPIVVNSSLPEVKLDGATGSMPLSSAASYGWSAFIALHWPASTAANTRGVANTGASFGQTGTPVWITMRSKVEVYPGNGSAAVAPHGVTLDAQGQPTNGPDYGYGDPQQYSYASGLLQPCTGQAPVSSPALIVLDETTQINNNQTFAGAAPATDPSGYNTKPQLIRYSVKMNQPFYARAIAGQYWYAGTPLSTAEGNYATALFSGKQQDPVQPFVNFAPPPSDPPPPNAPNLAGIEIKSAWRPLTAKETGSGHFITATVRYYEQPGDGSTSCYREATWGLVGMHVISFADAAPWVIWTSFEQADNILTADGKPTEDENGNLLIPAPSPTTPVLTSNPDVSNPTVTATGAFCANPGSQLYFAENPTYKTMPAGGNICVNGRWTQPEPIFLNANVEAHNAIKQYLYEHGQGSSPLMYYKLVAAQGVPVDFAGYNGGTFSTKTSYYSANAVIETDYSLGNFTGILLAGVPANVLGGKPFVNTRLLPFQSNRLDFSNMRMGGCAGCHDVASLSGADFSFALGNNVLQPEKTNAFASSNPLRNYFKPETLARVAR
jgi:hypothetical protein